MMVIIAPFIQVTCLIVEKYGSTVIVENLITRWTLTVQWHKLSQRYPEEGYSKNSSFDFLKIHIGNQNFKWCFFTNNACDY